MTTFADLVQLVSIITGRPDLVRETDLAIRKALRKFHSANTYNRDLKTVAIDLTQFPTTTGKWALDLTDPTYFTNFRRFSWLRIPPQQFQVPNGILQWWEVQWRDSPTIPIIDSENIFDEYMAEKPHYAYIAGNQMILRIMSGGLTILAAYYQFPSITGPIGGTQISSWLADQFPEFVADEAAGTVFKAIGKDDEAARYAQLFAENNLLIAASVVGEES